MSSSVDVFVLWVASLSEWVVCVGVGRWGVVVMPFVVLVVIPFVVLVVTCSVEVKSMVVVTGMVGVGLSMGEEGGMWLFWMCASVVSAIFFIREVLLLSE
jgi:hypothetical protein